MSKTEQFHLGDLLTVTTGKLLSPSHMDGLYRVVDFVTGQPHMTHQLIRAAREVKPHLLEQHPWLSELDPADMSPVELVAWLSWAVSKYGEMHDVTAMEFGQYVGREPIAELIEMAPHAQIIPIDPEDFEDFA